MPRQHRCRGMHRISLWFSHLTSSWVNVIHRFIRSRLHLYPRCAKAHADDPTLHRLPDATTNIRADSRFALLCNDVSHWLAANLNSVMEYHISMTLRHQSRKCSTVTYSDIYIQIISCVWKIFLLFHIWIPSTLDYHVYYTQVTK